jgi:ATP-dependent Clp protease adaptor protein ClpS
MNMLSLGQVDEETIVEEEIELDEELADTGVGNQARLVVYNDDHNTFDWVIKCFIEVLEHSSAQSEQLALLIHFKGKATVKTAPKRILKPKKDALVDRGLSAVIEGGEKE